MSRDLKTYNLLLDYLSGSLGEEEKLALEKLWADPEKRSELLELGAIEHGGDAYYRQEFEKLHQQMKLEQSRRTRFIWMAGAAAAAILLLFILMNFMAGGNQALNRESFLAENLPPLKLQNRGVETSLCKDLPLDVEVIIERLKNETGLNNICNRLLATAYFHSGEYQKSVEYWAKVDKEAIFYDESKWFQGLGLWALGREEESLRIWNDLIKEVPKSTYVDSARRLIEQIQVSQEPKK